jgi:carboxyl-terminal processing protease
LDPYKTRKLAKIIAIIIAVAMIVTSFSFILFLPSVIGLEGSVVYAAGNEDEEDLDQQLKNLKQYIEFIQRNYKDDVTLKELANGAFEGVVNSLNDPYSVYYETTEEGNDFIEAVSGEFSGVGLSVEDYNGQCRVISPIADTPADKAGIKSGDIIVKINQVDVSKKTVDEAVALMRGEEGTKVTVTVKRAGQTLSFTMTREKIKTASVQYEMKQDKVGYIKIASFDNDSDVEFRKACIALVNKGAESLIIDIRNNPGGLISTAAEIANQLIKKGPIVHFEQKGKILETISTDGTATLDLPVVLLVNQGSASSSEILAGALQDSKAATLVGTTTFGKGVSQQVVNFSNGTSMKLSMYYFLTPNKRKIDHVGIVPEYTVQNSKDIDIEALTEKYLSFAPMSEKVKPKAGDTGLNVYGAQQRLNLMGYSVKTSGTMDVQTVAAVKQFQKEKKLYPYGILDYTTMNLLDKAVTEYITGTTDGKDLQLEKALELVN